MSPDPGYDEVESNTKQKLTLCPIEYDDPKNCDDIKKITKYFAMNPGPNIHISF